MTHIICRAVYPAGELKTSLWIKENSAVCEVTGFEKEKITKDPLYEMSTKLYKEKDALEQFLSVRTNELFDFEDRIMLYDLTNTYLEDKKMAHLHLGLLAYWVVNTIRHQLKKEKICSAQIRIPRLANSLLSAYSSEIEAKWVNTNLQ